MAIAVAISVGNLFLHKPISDFCDAAFAALGRTWYERISITAIGGLSLLAALPSTRRNLHRLRRGWPLVAVIGTALLTAAAQRWLLVSNVELIHFPQFALIGALASAAGLPAPAAWSVATAAGVLDETYQHLVIYRDVAGTYFDYNDIVLNALGATWGVLLFAAPSAPAARIPPRRVAVAAAAIVLGLLFAGKVDPPRFSPLLLRANTGRFYRVLSPVEGMLGVLAAGGLLLLARRRGADADARAR
jgi:hypothetical protein